MARAVLGENYEQRLDPDHVLELYPFGLQENEANTRQRQILMPGVRLRRSPRTTAIDNNRFDALVGARRFVQVRWKC